MIWNTPIKDLRQVGTEDSQFVVKVEGDTLFGLASYVFYLVNSKYLIVLSVVVE